MDGGIPRRRIPTAPHFDPQALHNVCVFLGHVRSFILLLTSPPYSYSGSCHKYNSYLAASAITRHGFLPTPTPPLQDGADGDRSSRSLVPRQENLRPCATHGSQRRRSSSRHRCPSSHSGYRRQRPAGCAQTQRTRERRLGTHEGGSPHLPAEQLPVECRGHHAGGRRTRGGGDRDLLREPRRLLHRQAKHADSFQAIAPADQARDDGDDRGRHLEDLRRDGRRRRGCVRAAGEDEEAISEDRAASHSQREQVTQPEIQAVLHDYSALLHAQMGKSKLQIFIICSFIFINHNGITTLQKLWC